MKVFLMYEAFISNVACFKSQNRYIQLLLDSLLKVVPEN